MIHRKLAKVAMGCIGVLLLLAACGAPQPTATSAPTATPEPTTAPTETPPATASELLYVALGDSYAVCCGAYTYPERFANYIEQDLAVEVKLLNLATSGDTSDDLLEKLGSDYYRNALSKAQIVTVVITANDLLQCRRHSEGCTEEDLAAAMANYRQILEEILSIVSTKDTLVRTQTYDHFNFAHWQKSGVLEERKEMMDRWNAELIEIAAEYGIPVARVELDFNGPNGDQDPRDKGYLARDGLHPSDQGSLRIAELLRGLGYEPLAEE